MGSLRCTHSNDHSIRNITGYNEAYDIICNLSSEDEGGAVTFGVSPREEWVASHSLPLVANNVEGDYWESTVQKTIIYPDDNPFTDAGLAGAILWGMTFYGFTNRKKWQPTEATYTH